MNWSIEDKEVFYETLCKLYETHDFPVVPKDRLPNRIFVAYETLEDGEIVLLYAVPVMITDSSMCKIVFPVSNKLAPKILKKGALDKLLDIVEIVMKSQGYDFIFTTSGTPKLMEIFNNRGYTSSDEGVTYYSKPL